MQATILSGELGTYEGGEATLYLRIYARKTFTTSDGNIVVGSGVGDPDFYASHACPVVSGVVTYPQFTIDTTSDAIDVRTGGYAFSLFTAGGVWVKTIYRKLLVPVANTDLTLSDLVNYTYNSVGPDLTPPTDPTDLAASVTVDGPSLAWTASTDAGSGVDHYEVKVATDFGFTTDVQTFTTPNNTPSYAPAGLDGTTLYYAKVRAVDARDNVSGYSNIVNFTTPVRVIARVNVGGGAVGLFESDAAYRVTGTVGTASPATWNDDALTYKADDSVYATCLYGVVAERFTGLTPNAPYTLHVIGVWEGVFFATDLLINGVAVGTASYPTAHTVTDTVFQVVADDAGELVVYSNSGNGAGGLYNALVLTEAEIEFTSAVVLGNSITIIPADHAIMGVNWWGTWGMAASVAANDFVHKLADMLDIPITGHYCFNWESAHDTFNKSAYDSFFDGDPDLVLIRLGENVTNNTGYQADFEALITYVRTQVPYARIVVTGNFWADATKDADQEAAAKAQGVLWIDFTGLDNLGSNRSFVGATVSGDDLAAHTITDAGVAIHPSDAGMLAIATRIFDNLGTS